MIMAVELKAGQTVRVTINKAVTRDGARKTLERMFMRDKGFSGPIDARSANFIDLPRRRGGCIWTKRANKVHPTLAKGEAADIKVTAQTILDLKSVESFVDIAAK
jgi:hypothetical protein